MFLDSIFRNKSIKIILNYIYFYHFFSIFFPLAPHRLLRVAHIVFHRFLCQSLKVQPLSGLANIHYSTVLS